MDVVLDALAAVLVIVQLLKALGLLGPCRSEQCHQSEETGSEP